MRWWVIERIISWAVIVLIVWWLVSLTNWMTWLDRGQEVLWDIVWAWKQHSSI